MTPTFRLTGHFADAELEAEFQRDNETSLRQFLGFSIPLASLVFLAYGLHDALVVPAVRPIAWTLRYGVFLPVTLATLAVIRSRMLVRFGQLALLVYGLALNLVVLTIGATAPTPGYLYTSYAVLFVTLGPFVVRMNVVSQLINDDAAPRVGARALGLSIGFVSVGRSRAEHLARGVAAPSGGRTRVRA